MAKEEIKKLLENSKKDLDSEYDGFVNSVQDDLNSFKKKTLNLARIIGSNGQINIRRMPLG